MRTTRHELTEIETDLEGDVRLGMAAACRRCKLRSAFAKDVRQKAANRSGEVRILEIRTKGVSQEGATLIEDGWRAGKRNRVVGNESDISKECGRKLCLCARRRSGTIHA